jgi:hypothetical protein
MPHLLAVFNQILLLLPHQLLHNLRHSSLPPLIYHLVTVDALHVHHVADLLYFIHLASEIVLLLF